MINPYENVDFGTASRVFSVSHQHLRHARYISDDTPYSEEKKQEAKNSAKNACQSVFDGIYDSGVKHFALSRYRPCITTYPFDYENNSFTYVANPWKSTEDIETLKQNWGVAIDIDDDVIGCPNAEHVYPHVLVNGVWKIWRRMHINGLGSLYESFTNPDPKNGYNGRAYSDGLAMHYPDAIDAILNGLQYTDGGGIIINHPHWTGEDSLGCDIERFIKDCLDYDQRVLGTDIIASASFNSYDYNKQLIDNILLTGRRCWLFCQADWDEHERHRGRNELLIPNGLSTKADKEHACLKAYRDGAFFGRWANTDLSITNVSFSGNVFSLTADNADGIIVVVDGEEHIESGNSVEITVPNDAVYVRAAAYKEPSAGSEYLYDDIVFTNPIMVNPRTYEYDPMYDGQGEDDPEPAYNENKRKLWFWG